MAKIIYLEATMALLADSMKFKEQKQMDSFVADGFTENETIDGVLYYIEKDLGK
jgi:hypothetical protein